MNKDSYHKISMPMRLSREKKCFVCFTVTPFHCVILLLLLCFPARSLGFTIFSEIFVYLTVFNPTIEVVTFCLSGWCILGVFLLLAFIRLRHEHEDLLSPCK